MRLLARTKASTVALPEHDTNRAQNDRRVQVPRVVSRDHGGGDVGGPICHAKSPPSSTTRQKERSRLQYRGHGAIAHRQGEVCPAQPSTPLRNRQKHWACVASPVTLPEHNIHERLLQIKIPGPSAVSYLVGASGVAASGAGTVAPLFRLIAAVPLLGTSHALAATERR